MLKYNIRTRSLAHPSTIENLLAVENDVVPFDRAHVLGAGLRPGLWPVLLVTLRRSHTTGMQSKVYPTYKTKYRVANWPAYNQALVRRGDVTV